MVGVTVLVRDADEVEIWNIALAERYRGRGLGRAAIGAIADRCRRRRFANDRRHVRLQPRHDRVLSQGRLPFRRVRQGYFDTYPVAVVENGIRARDMVMFQMPLAPSSTSNRTTTPNGPRQRPISDASPRAVHLVDASMDDRLTPSERARAPRWSFRRRSGSGR